MCLRRIAHRLTKLGFACYYHNAVPSLSIKVNQCQQPRCHQPRHLRRHHRARAPLQAQMHSSPQALSRALPRQSATPEISEQLGCASALVQVQPMEGLATAQAARRARATQALGASEEHSLHRADPDTESLEADSLAALSGSGEDAPAPTGWRSL